MVQGDGELICVSDLFPRILEVQIVISVRNPGYHALIAPTRYTWRAVDGLSYRVIHSQDPD
jgi:hypothetical protein